MGKVTFKIRQILLVVAICLFFVILAACHKTYYFQQKGIFTAQSPFLELDCCSHSGTLVINGVTYQLDLAFKPNGSGISIFADKDSDQWVLDTIKDDIVFVDKLIWEAETTEKENKLYLTVIRDNISNYAGKTIILEFKPNEG